MLFKTTRPNQSLFVFVFASIVFLIPADMPLSSPYISSALPKLRTLPPIPQSLGVSYLKATLDKTRVSSHITFLHHCQRLKVIPNGFRLKFHFCPSSKREEREIKKILFTSSSNLMAQAVRKFSLQSNKYSKLIQTCRRQMTFLCSEETAQFIIATARTANRDLHESLKKTKKMKLEKLLPERKANRPHTTSQAPHDPDKLIVTIPANIHLSDGQKTLLRHGLKFVPLKPTTNTSSTLFHCQQFFRRLRLAAHFKDQSPPTTCPSSGDISHLFPKEPSTWTPNPGKYPALDHYIDKCTQEIQQLHFQPLKHSNLTDEEWKALRELRQRTDIVVKPADKGGAIVIWQSDCYEKEIARQLSDSTFYSPLKKPTVKEDNTLIRKTINTAISTGHLPSEASRAIVREPREPKFYTLPKIHKPDNPGRPIVSACSCPTTLISQFIDSLLQPLVTALPTYIKDTNHALQLLDQFSFPPDHSDRFLFTMDVSSLYTNIPHNEGLQAMKHFLKNSSFDINITTILRLAELVLTLNSFSFGDNHYVQTRGVAMGTKMGPSYACLFVGFIEEQIFSSYPRPIPPLFRRYIDDIIGITTSTKTELLDFIEFVSTFHPALKFTHSISEDTLSFLDIQVSITNSQKLSTSVFYKSTDSHSYLDFASNHPPSTKNSIPYSQFYRLRRLCSNDNDYKQQVLWMSSFFRRRGYPSKVIDHAANRALHTPRTLSQSPSHKKNQSDRPVLTLTYHPHNLPVKNILLKNFDILLKDPKLKSTFYKPPLVAYKRDTNLRDHLVRASHKHSQNISPPGNHCCNKPRCKTCPFLNTSTHTFKGPSGKSFTIKSPFTCQSFNLVYIISCSLCSKLYCGETYRSLDDRFKEHLQAVRLRKDTPVGSHFNSPGHNLFHMTVAAVHQNHSDVIHRKFLETSLISRLGTVTPHGLNIRD